MTEILNKNTILVKNKTPFIKFKPFETTPFCVAGFSTRIGGVSTGCYESMNLSFGRGDDRENVMENFKLMGASAGFEVESVCLPNQCHSNSVRIVTANNKGSGILTPKITEEADAQITDVPGVTLICYGADCVPIYLCDTLHRAIGLVHAGWKGTLNNIVGSTLSRMNHLYNTFPRDIIAVIGPSICFDCYEVGSDVAEPFLMIYSDKLKSIESVIPSFNIGQIIKPLSEDKYLLNLWNANMINLIQAGVPRVSISISGYCTKCHSNMLFSHRAHGNERGSNAAFMYIKQRTQKLII